MKAIEISPHQGIGKIKIGMKQEDVREAISSPADNIPAHSASGIEFPESDYFLESSIQVTYETSTGNVDWIAINDNVPFKVVYEGLDLFNVAVEKVVAHTKKYGGLDTSDQELGYSYTFPTLGISYWRSSITDDLVKELADANDEQDRECLVEEIEKSKFFEQISVAKLGYGERNS